MAAPENNISEEVAELKEECQPEKIVVEENVELPIVDDEVQDQDGFKAKWWALFISATCHEKTSTKNQIQPPNNSVTTTVVSEPVSNVDITENGHDEEGESYSVFIKGLPVSATLFWFC